MGQIAIAQPPRGIVAGPLPTAQVNLVERQRLFEPIRRPPAGHPVHVVPTVAVQVGHPRGRPRRHLGRKPERVRLLEYASAVMADLILVERSFAQPRHEQLPKAAGNVLPHRMPAAVPVVEIAHQAHAGGVGGPDGEIHAVDAVDLPQLRPQPVVTLPVPPLVEQVEVVVGQQVGKGVRIVHGNRLFSAFLGYPKHVPRRASVAVGMRQGTNRLEQTGRMNSPHRQRAVAVRRVDHPRLVRRWQERPHRQHPAPRLVDLVGTEQLKGILMPSFNQLTDSFQACRRSHANLLAGDRSYASPGVRLRGTGCQVRPKNAEP